jgi:DNA-binding beta-propeller fold protein YncE
VNEGEVGAADSGSASPHGGEPEDVVRVFVSYRRDDVPDATDRLAVSLKTRLGNDHVFLDVDSIDIGARFAKVVGDWVARCDVLLAVIGRSWLEATDDEGLRRLEDPKDYVRLEVEAGLERDIRVVPVLIHGARMPKAAELPDSLVPLLEFNAVELSRAHWDFDVDNLIGALQRIAAATLRETADRERAEEAAAEHAAAERAAADRERAEQAAAEQAAAERLAADRERAQQAAAERAAAEQAAAGQERAKQAAADRERAEQAAAEQAAAEQAAAEQAAAEQAAADRERAQRAAAEREAADRERAKQAAADRAAARRATPGHAEGVAVAATESGSENEATDTPPRGSPKPDSIGRHDPGRDHRRPPVKRRSRLLGAAAAIAGLLLVVLAATGAFSGGGGAGKASKSLAVVSSKASPAPARTASVVQTINVGKNPKALELDQNKVWVANHDDNTVTEIDANSGRVVGNPIAVGKGPTHVVADSGVVLVKADDGTVTRISEQSGTVLGSPIKIGNCPCDMSAGKGRAWMATRGLVTQIDVKSGNVVGSPIVTGKVPQSMAVGSASIAACNQDNTVTLIDPSSGRLVAQPSVKDCSDTDFRPGVDWIASDVGIVPLDPSSGALKGNVIRIRTGCSSYCGLFDTPGVVWLLNAVDNTVTRIDASGKVIGTPIGVGKNPYDWAVGLGSVWIANYDDNTVTRIDPRSGAVVGDPIDVGSSPNAIVAGPSGVWVANDSDNTVSHIRP